MKSIRLEATKSIWVAYGFGLFFLFATVLWGDSAIEIGHIVIGVAMSIAAFLGTGMIWNWGNASLESEFYFEQEEKNQGHETEKEKRKNQRRKLDILLQNLSDDELIDLREELQEARVQGLSDDGELVYKDGRR